MIENQECLVKDGKYDCDSLFDCCNCGGNDCGCRYCFSCNACENCIEDRTQ